MNTSTFQFKTFTVITLITSIWIVLSETWRYFALVMPRVKAHWNGMAGIADMNPVIFLIWGLWMIILSTMTVFICWLYQERFGNDNKTIIVAGTIVWLLFFVLFWIGTANMGFSTWSILWITLPLSWIELVVACWIASKLFKKYSF